MCCISLMGVWMFRGRNTQGGITELADWETIAVKNRTVYIAYDSDVMTKPEVKLALRRLTAILKRMGASEVCPVIIPHGEGDKVGLDDFFYAGGTVDQLKEAVDMSAVSATGIQIGRAHV